MADKGVRKFKGTIFTYLLDCVSLLPPFEICTYLGDFKFEIPAIAGQPVTSTVKTEAVH